MTEKKSAAEIGPEDTWSGASAFSLAVIAIGLALEQTNGRLGDTSLGLVMVSAVLAILAISGSRLPTLERIGHRGVLTVIGVGVIAELAAQLIHRPGLYLGPDTSFMPHHELLAAAAVISGAIISNGGWLRRIRFPVLLVLFFALGVWLLRSSPLPYIDVVAWHADAFHALAAWHNPYAITMPNIYGRTDLYAPGLADAHVVRVGYPYPPLALILNWLGQLVTGDYRFTNLIALTATGALLGSAGERRVGAAAAALFLLTPRLLFVLEQGWTEPLVLGVLALTVFTAIRRPRALPVVFGLLLAMKQYMILAAPLGLLLLPRPLTRRSVLRFYVIAGLTAAVTIIPFLLANPAAFFNSVVSFEGKQPFRQDALSLMAWLAWHRGPLLPNWVPFAVAIPGIALALWRAPRSPAGFAAGTGLVLLLFFVVAKQAFANYYFLCAGALALAAGTTRVRLRYAREQPLTPGTAQGRSAPGRIPESGAERSERVPEEVRDIHG